MVSHTVGSFKELPILKVMCEGQLISFLVDSGATNSVIKQSDLLLPLTSETVRSIGAGGKITCEHKTIPVHCKLDEKQCHHQFLNSRVCPINLMGRDLMMKLGVSVIATEGSLTITAVDLEVENDAWLWVYQWLLDPPLAEDFLHVAKSNVPPNAEFMSPRNLHCTAHVATHSDETFETTFFTHLRDNLQTLWFCWKGCSSFIIVQLADYQVPFYLIPHSFPHISLSKSRNMQWRDLGPLALLAQTATDWVDGHSPSTGLHRTQFTFTTGVTRSLYLLLTESPQMMQLDIPDYLSSVPPTLWATDKYDVGLVRGAEPVHITPKSSYRPSCSQYPLKPEALAGIEPVFNSLLQKGVIVPCPDSPVTTPILPVKKPRPHPQPNEWRFVQDLRAVNAAVIPRAPIVPNPHTILGSIPSHAKCFSVVDLSNAFFSVPVHKDSQFWFAFFFKGKKYTFTRLCQGYTESPTIYNQVLATSLESFHPPKSSVLLQYVDDLLLASPDQASCETDTIALLCHLAAEGHKASLKKLQFAKTQVQFLGHLVTGEGHSLAVDRVSAIQTIPRPFTKKQLLSFLGTTSYCRSFIPDYAPREAPLREVANSVSQLSAPITWTTDAESAFVDLKQALMCAPTLGYPDTELPFTLFVDSKSGCMTSVLCQKHGDKQRPVGYFSCKLDAVAAGLPTCLQAVAAAERALNAVRDIVGYAELTVMVPHAVSLMLQSQTTSHLTASRYLRYHTSLLDLPNIRVQRCNVLNPSTLFPLPSDGDPHTIPHDCLHELEQVCTPRPDLKSTPLTNPDLILFVDGSASRSPTGINQVGFSVCTADAIIQSGSLPTHYSAQTAELVALTEACKAAEGKSVNIFTDSRYAFGVVHDFGALWKQRKFLKSDGKPVLNHLQVAALLEAILLPSAVAVCKCSAHTGMTDAVSRGNAFADKSAKEAALTPLSPSLVSFPLPLPPPSITDAQSLSSSSDEDKWKKADCVFTDGIWRCSDGRPCLPSALFPMYCELTHGVDHVSKEGMMKAIQKIWFTKGFTVAAEKHCKKCIICLKNNNAGTVRLTRSAAHPPPDQPFDHLQMDFIELTPSQGKRYCLVIVDMFSKWVEAFATKHQTAQTVAKHLLTDIIPRFGIPRKISSDNGSHFVNKVVEEIGRVYEIDLKQHCSYHPQSAGAVERENGTIKAKLRKLTEETKLPWPDCLPIALTYMRMRERARTGLSPFEILFGRPPVTPFSTHAPELFQGHESLRQYCIGLSRALSSIRDQVKDTLPKPAEGPLHPLKPGDFVLIRSLPSLKKVHRRWEGPYQILLVTDTAVKIAERPTWIHATHCKFLSHGTEKPEEKS